ncbi:MAG: hypothetical protein A3G18_04260 [Rhodospirillales bacterium RIFCSPLOWO2_12_FULL_58_28]|nr:MAG: hypothetical protein A3H92_05140 [Rhodospirillales bacterium RIFCSPLOWO2_02_FULL_58_16]OHC78729.1 MAG: hypothetical protein A3G18_04260 [Rhodospirillales bacterium RIFCSPLOWO2_12_FULL_58_28]
MNHFFTVAVWPLCALMTLAASGIALADEVPAKHPDAQSGTPLNHYCLHVPDLSVDRPGSVDTWVKICTVYFNANPATKSEKSGKSEKPSR